MPRFIVERDCEAVTEEGLLEIRARARIVGEEHFPDIVWKESRVCANDDGSFKSFCVYEAPSAERLREHTDWVPGMVLLAVHEIVGELTPDAVQA